MAQILHASIEVRIRIQKIYIKQISSKDADHNLLNDYQNS